MHAVFRIKASRQFPVPFYNDYTGIDGFHAFVKFVRPAPQRSGKFDGNMQLHIVHGFRDIAGEADQFIFEKCFFQHGHGQQTQRRARTLALPSDWAFVNEASGQPVKVTIGAPGTYTLQVWGNGGAQVFLDRIALVDALDGDYVHGSTAGGGHSSPKAGVTNVSIPDKRSYEPYHEDALPNYAARRPASASSESQAHPPDASVDDTVLTYWRSDAADPEPWWQVDLGSEMRIYELVLTFPMDGELPEERRNFDVLASNDPLFQSYSVLASQGSGAIGEGRRRRATLFAM